MPHVGNVASGGRAKRPKPLGVSVSERKLLLRLCKAIEAQTVEIGRLATSNEALIQAMLEAEPEDEPGLGGRSLSG